MNPFLVPGIAQEVEALQKRQQDLLKSQSEVDAATSAYRDYLASRQNQPQFQMPQVQPNKTAAGIGAVLALIGALTGDKRAVPAFGQFAGGLQQGTEAQRQRLLQEHQLKMQNQAQKDKAIGQLLGFDLENAQAKYIQESKSQQMLRDQKQKSAEAVKDRQFELEKIGIQNASKQAVAKTAAEASIERAKIQAVPKAEALYTSMLKSGVPEPQARDIAYQMSLYAAKTDKLKSGAEYDRIRPKLAREGMTLKEKLANQSEEGRNARAEAGRAASWKKTEYTQGQINERQGLSGSLGPGKSGPPVAYFTRMRRDPQWAKAEVAAKAADKAVAAAQKKVTIYEAYLRSNKGDPDFFPEVVEHEQYLKNKAALAKAKQDLALQRKIMQDRENAISPLPPMDPMKGGISLRGK